jgi:hypothetical protein
MFYTIYIYLKEKVFKKITQNKKNEYDTHHIRIPINYADAV